MSTGSWFKYHKRSLIIHTSIIVGFVLFIIFVSEPLFDRREAVQGESRLHQISLPAETNNIQYGIDKLGVTTHMLEVEGWAFIEGYDSVDSEIYIVLKSADRTYVFTTETVIRQDVTQYFKELDLNLDYSGFIALIPTGKVASGKYSVGIYIWKDDIEALQYTNRVIKL